MPTSSRPLNFTEPDVGSISRSTHRADGRLAAAALAHEAERLATVDREATLGDRLHDALDDAGTLS